MANTFLYDITDVWANSSVFNSIRIKVEDGGADANSNFFNFCMGNVENSIIRGRMDGLFFATSLWLGNTSSNLFGNSTHLRIGNSTVNSSINSSTLALGLNVQVSLTGFSIGNSTVNAVANSSTLSFANLSINSISIGVGNSTVNAFMNSSIVTLNGNLSISAIQLKVGNSTVNSSVNSSLIQTTGTLQFGTFVANTTTTLAGYIIVNDASGTPRRVGIMV